MSNARVSPAKTRRYRGVEVEERVIERRRQFVESGLECFGTRGYHAVTVRELCAQARLTERYFYESFKDREALFAAVYENLIVHLREDFVTAAVSKAPVLEDMARAGLGVFFRRLQKDPRVGRMLLVEVLTVSQEMEHRAQSATFGFGDLLKQMTAATLSHSARLSQDMDLIATGLIGSCVHIAMRWNADGYRQPAKKVIDTAMTFFTAVIRQLGAESAHTA
ncbi:MAG: TetR/AcrR family transcriptional regulator [Panacagrimonas sp.]